MTQAVNDACLEQLGLQGFSEGENIFIGAGAPTSQQAAYPLRDQMHRIVANGTANASLVLKSILTSDNPGMCVVFNDAPTNAVVVFPFKGFGTGALDTAESINSVANGSFTVSAGNFAVFIASPIAVKRKGGATGLVNWSAALYSA